MNCKNDDCVNREDESGSECAECVNNGGRENNYITKLQRDGY
jgi:hypothetical protein